MAESWEERTPEFVRWTIARPCPLREEYRWTDPEQTERLLRSLRAAFEALRDGRVHEGVAFAEAAAAGCDLEQLRGFVLEEALLPFGGQQLVAAACGDCAANALGGWAGCYGMFHLAEPESFHGAVNDSLRRIGGESSLRREFHDAWPLWYGFWIDSPVSVEHARLLADILAPVAEAIPHAAPSLSEFLAALRVSLEVGLPMYAKLIPTGRRVSGGWKLDPHCKRCGAPRKIGGGPCPACGVRGEECAGRTRKVRGERPYAPLIRQLGPEKLSRLVAEYNRQSHSEFEPCAAGDDPLELDREGQ